MKVKRIVANIEARNPAEAHVFYKDIFGLSLVSDYDWIRIYGTEAQMDVQVNITSRGGSGVPIPELSIEVDDLEEALARVKNAKIAIEYGPEGEPWGVRRFFIRDPFGKLINVMEYQ